MVTSKRLIGLLILVVGTGDACHGPGGSGSTLLPQSSSVNTGAALLSQGLTGKTGAASFSVTVPRGSTPGMQSLVVSLASINGAAPVGRIAPVTLNLTARTPGCALQSDGSLRCTTSITVPAGTDTFTMVTYQQANGMGAQVSTTQTTTSITPGGKTSCTQTSTGLMPAKGRSI